jgi:uncharacterized protein (TIGR03435 family)
LAVHREKKEAPVYELLVAKGGPKMRESVEAPPPGSDATPSPQLDPGPPRKLALGKDGFPDLPSGTSMAMMDGKARWRATKETTAQLASMLAAQLGQPVTDATGLKAKYDFTLSWATESSGGGRGAAIGSQQEGGSPLAGMSESEDRPTLFSAVQTQLGLRLEKKKGSIELLVVDPRGEGSDRELAQRDDAMPTPEFAASFGRLAANHLWQSTGYGRNAGRSKAC